MALDLPSGDPSFGLRVSKTFHPFLNKYPELLGPNIIVNTLDVLNAPTNFPPSKFELKVNTAFNGGPGIVCGSTRKHARIPARVSPFRVRSSRSWYFVPMIFASNVVRDGTRQYPSRRLSILLMLPDGVFDVWSRSWVRNERTYGTEGGKNGEGVDITDPGVGSLRVTAPS